MLLTTPLMADRFYISTRTGGHAGNVDYKNEDIIKFDTQDKSGGNNGTWSLLFDGSDVGLKSSRIDGFYVGDDFILLSFANDFQFNTDGRKTRVKASDIVKFNWDSLGENNTQGRFEMYFDGSDVGVKRNVDGVALDSSGNLVFSIEGTTKLSNSAGGRFQARKQDLIRFSGFTGNDTAGSFELFMDGRAFGLTRARGDIKGVDIESPYVFLATRSAFTIGDIRGRNQDILRCDLTSLPIDQCENPEIIFNTSDLDLGREKIQGIQVEFSTVANDDRFTTDQNELLSGVNVFNDNGSGADSDPQRDLLVVTRVNGVAGRVGTNFSLKSGALVRLNANGALTYDDNHRFDHLSGSAKGQDQFTYRVEDGHGDYADATVSIKINGRNDAPTNIAISANTVAENKPAGTAVGILTSTDKDSGDTHTYRLVPGAGSTNNVSFQIVGKQLQTAASFNFETKSGYNIRIRSTDQSGQSFEKAFAVSIINGNDAPTNILLSSASVPEGQAIGTIVGNLSTIDLEGSDTHSYSLVSGVGGTDNASFQIVGSALKTAAILNAAAKSSHSVRIRTTDSGGLTFDKVFTITATDVNHAPTFSKGANQSVNEDSGASIVSNWASNIDDGDSNATQSLTFSVTGNNNPSLFSVQPAVAPSGQLTFTPAPDANGTATLTMILSDDGGIANGGQDTSSAQVFTITINSVNDKPSLSATNPASVEENAGIQTLANWASFDPGASNEATQGVIAYSVTGVGNPALFSAQPSVSTNGTLTFTPASSTTGTSTFTVTVQDNGGTANGGVDTSDAHIFTITVNNINDKPNFSATNPAAVNEDAGAQTLSSWATFDPGASNESGQSVLAYSVSSVSNPALFSSQPSVDTSGNLTYTPAAEANGSSTFAVRVQDNGGTTNGGVDTSDAQTFTISVNSVNDKPSFSATNPVSVDEDSGAQTVGNWVTFNAGATNESSQTVSSYVVSNVSNPGLFGTQPVVASNGTLSYTPAPGFSGSSTFDVKVIDNGGTANGGVDTSDTQSFSITVNAVDDSPVAVTDTATVSEDSGANAIDVLTNDTDTDGGAKLISSVTQGSHGTVVITGGGSGLTYQSNANYCNSLTVSPDSFTYTLTPGGSSTSVNVSVTCVNDVPVAQNKSGIAIQTNMKRIGIDAGLLTGISDNDSGVDGCSPSYTLASVSAVSGGTVSNVNSMAATFDFEPTAGYTGSATVNYTIQDNGCPTPAQTSATATITLTVSGSTIWFVDTTAGSNGTGTLASPFNNLASAAAVDGAGHRIFIYSGTATTGITLNSNEWLIGQGVTGTTFDALLAISPPSGTLTRPTLGQTAPTVQGNVVLAANSAVRGLSINPSPGTEGLSATGITGLTVAEVSVNTTNATAVNLVNSDGALSFNSVSASGGSNGIIWNNSSAASGSLTVTGDGSNTSVGGNASGGTISGMTGADNAVAGSGIYLKNAANVALRRMTINGTNQNFGIRGFSVNNFALEYSTVGGTNGTSISGIGEGSVYFGDNNTENGLNGVATVTSSNISGGKEDNFRIYNISGTLNRITVTGSTFGQNQSGATDSVGFVATNSGTVLNATLTNNTFTGAPDDLFEFVGQASTTMDLIFQNNALSNNHAGNVAGSGGMTVGTSGAMTFNVSNNTMRDAKGHAVRIIKGSSGTSLNGTINNNTIGVTGVADSGSQNGDGINLTFSGTGSGIMAITNNIIRNYSGTAGIYADNTSGTYTLDLTITGNTVAEPGSLAAAGLALAAGLPSSSDDVDICANIASNDMSTADPNNANDIYLAVSSASSSIRLPGYSGSATTHVESFVLGNNSTSGTVVFALADGGASASNFTGGAACSTP